MRVLILFGALIALAFPAVAQEGAAPVDSIPATELPLPVAEEIVRRLNAADVSVFAGDLLIDAGEVRDGDLAILDGDLTLAGTVEGDVLVLNGDAIIQSGAAITGDLLVVGGMARGAESGRIGGDIVSYGGGLAYERVDGRYRHLRGPRPVRSLTSRGGSADFLITTGRSYNRVEGMPISFGPRLRTDSSNPLRLQALAIYRSESGLTLDPDLMGYWVRAEQYLAGHRQYRIGIGLHSVVDPIEEWQLSDLESGLATFLFHRDYRDHYQRRGWSATASWEPSGSLQLVQLEWRWERQQTRPTGSPWSLFRNADDWRPQPVVAEGRVGSLVLRGEYDSRTALWNPASGWLIRGQLEQLVSGGLEYPDVVDATTLAPVSQGPSEYGHPLTGLLDLRSYNRVSADSRLNFRVVAGGSLKGDPLPPQRQHALGGEGSLPGYSLFTADCGARDARVRPLDGTGAPGSADLFPHYGCDAFGLIQAEFRGKLSFRFRWDAGPWREGREDSDRVWDFGWDMSPDWALFVDAGRAWTFHDRPDEETLVNVGAGLLLERIGLYLAVPVSGGSGANLFIRLGPRF